VSEPQKNKAFARNFAYWLLRVVDVRDYRVGEILRSESAASFIANNSPQ